MQVYKSCSPCIGKDTRKKRDRPGVIPRNFVIKFLEFLEIIEVLDCAFSRGAYFETF